MGRKRKPPRKDERARFGERIRAARVKRGLQIDDVARLMGASTSTYYSWEEGTHVPRDVRKLADVLGTTVGALHGE